MRRAHLNGRTHISDSPAAQSKRQLKLWTLMAVL